MGGGRYSQGPKTSDWHFPRCPREGGRPQKSQLGGLSRSLAKNFLFQKNSEQAELLHSKGPQWAGQWASVSALWSLTLPGKGEGRRPGKTGKGQTQVQGNGISRTPECPVPFTSTCSPCWTLSVEDQGFCSSCSHLLPNLGPTANTYLFLSLSPLPLASIHIQNQEEALSDKF